MDLGLASAYGAMDTGFCLWIGAGATVQIAGSPQHAPQWPELTRQLEQLAGVKAAPGAPYPDRLEACAAALGDTLFLAELRRRYYTDLGMVLLRRGNDLLDAEDCIPHGIRQLAALGQAANPIVNFNIEPFSSVLISRPAGPMRVLSYAQPHKPMLTYDEPSGRFRRLVYHPHGVAIGSCVMTKSQYRALGATLAFRLAVHAAFGSILAIVGMSLDDVYLREQITAFRSDLNEIFWFNSTFNDEPATWARENDVHMLQVEWPEFWQWWLDDRGFEVDENHLHAAWYRVLREAWNEVRGGAAFEMGNSLGPIGDDLDLVQRSKYLGEPGRPAEGVEAVANVVDRVASRMRAKGFTPPDIGTIV
jgi:hypothetical protein